MTNAAAENESPATFLKKAGEQLRAMHGIDEDLAKVLCDHLLTATPAEDAIVKAKAAIGEIATARATQASEVSADGR